MVQVGWNKCTGEGRRRQPGGSEKRAASSGSSHSRRCHHHFSLLHSPLSGVAITGSRPQIIISDLYTPYRLRYKTPTRLSRTRPKSVSLFGDRSGQLLEAACLLPVSSSVLQQHTATPKCCIAAYRTDPEQFFQALSRTPLARTNAEIAQGRKHPPAYGSAAITTHLAPTVRLPSVTVAR